MYIYERGCSGSIGTIGLEMSRKLKLSIFDLKYKMYKLLTNLIGVYWVFRFLIKSMKSNHIVRSMNVWLT